MVEFILISGVLAVLTAFTPSEWKEIVKNIKE